jgi:hypothetical protein
LKIGNIIFTKVQKYIFYSDWDSFNSCIPNLLFKTCTETEAKVLGLNWWVNHLPVEDHVRTMSKSLCTGLVFVLVSTSTSIPWGLLVRSGNHRPSFLVIVTATHLLPIHHFCNEPPLFSHSLWRSKTLTNIFLSFQWNNSSLHYLNVIPKIKEQKKVEYYVDWSLRRNFIPSLVCLRCLNRQIWTRAYDISWHSRLVINIFLVILGFELRALSLLSRHSTTW